MVIFIKCIFILKGDRGMTVRDILNSNDIKDLLTENSIEAIEKFLSYYAVTSQPNMRSAVYRLLYLEISKDDVSKVDFSDYLLSFPEDEKVLSAQEIYRQMFFKFLYLYDYLEVSLGFEEKWIKNTERQQFEKQKLRLETPKEKITKPKKTLNIEELTSIQKIIDADSTKLATLKMQFCWFAIFELGIEVVDVKNIKSSDFVDGALVLKEKNYELPLQYHQMFKVMNERDKNGLASINEMIEKLGQIALLNRKLTPLIVKLTRKEFVVICANCSIDYPNLSHNWLSVNNRIVCVSCAEELKKKDFEINILPIENSEFQDEIQEEPSILFTYADLKQKLQNLQKEPIDFLKLHELQMKIGQLGEAYVYKVECEKLVGTKYIDKIDESKALDPSNGFDILSFELDGTPLYIEVKATVGNDDEFYLSNHELITSKRMKESGHKYVIYFLKEIISDNPNLTIIENLDEGYLLKEMNWKVTKMIVESQL